LHYDVKGKLSKLFRRKRRNYIVRTATTFSLFFVALIILSSFSIITLKNDEVETELRNAYGAVLRQVQIYCDTNIINKVSFQLYENLESNNLLVTRFLEKSENDRTSTLLEIYDFSVGLVKLNEYIHSLYLYREADDSLISSEQGYITHATTDSKYQSLYNSIVLRDLMRSGSRSKWYTAEENRRLLENEDSPYLRSYVPTLTYGVLLPYSRAVSRKTGCLIVNIDEGAIKSAMRQFMGNNQSILMLVDESLQPVVIEGDASIATGLLAGMDDLILQYESGSRQQSFDAVSYNLAWTSSTYGGWHYIYAAPDSMIRQQILRSTYYALLILLAITLLASVGFTLISRRMLRPIQNLSEWAANQSFLVTHPGRNVFESLRSRFADLEDTILKNEESIINRSANDLIYGAADINEIKTRLNLVNIRFENGPYCLVGFHVDQNNMKESDNVQREFVLYNAMQIINRILADQFEYTYSSIATNRIVYIIQIAPAERVFKLSRLLEEEILRNLGHMFNIYLSLPEGDLRKMPEQLRKMNAGFQYGFLFGSGRLFRQEQIDLHEKSTLKLPLEQYGLALAKPVQHSVHEALADLRQTVYAGTFSVTAVRTGLLKAFQMLHHAMHEQDPDFMRKNEDSLLAAYVQLSSLDEHTDWLNDLVSQFYDRMASAEDAVQANFAGKLIDYIDENILSNISLSSVSEAFEVSAGHMSRIFRQSFGVTFQEYVKDKKLRKAAEILIKNEKVEMQELALCLGYVNMTYFIKVFKEKFGLTPLQYRRTHKHM
jgi:two-component system response regulator YesN